MVHSEVTHRQLAATCKVLHQQASEKKRKEKTQLRAKELNPSSGSESPHGLLTQQRNENA